MTATDGVAGRNWASTLTYRASTLVEATSIEQVQETVAAEPAIRALGTRHSFTSLADTEHALVTVTGIPADPVIDDHTVVVGAGTRYGELAPLLQSRGLALANMGSLPHISVGGAVSTGTHGSGTASLSSFVNVVELVVADGSRLTLRRGDDGFDGAVVGLGALGVLVRIGLDLQPSYQVRQEVYSGLSWEALFADVAGVMRSGYSVSIFTGWTEDEIPELLVKTRDDGDSPPAALFGAQLLDEAGRQRFWGENQTERGSLGPWCERLPHFRLDSTPSLGEEIQTEYFVPLERGGEALRAVRALGPELASTLVITELRTTLADELWLSPAFQRDSLCIHFTWHDDSASVAALVPKIEEVLRPFDPRPHWGKVFDQLDVDSSYARASDFRELAARCDPGGKFRNEFLDRTVWA